MSITDFAEFFWSRYADGSKKGCIQISSFNIGYQYSQSLIQAMEFVINVDAFHLAELQGCLV